MARHEGIAVFVMGALLCFVSMAHAATYIVGGTAGWGSPGVADWFKKKTFKNGDNLVFIYDRTRHNIAEVSKADYELCKAKPGDDRGSNGYDVFTLAKGFNYFISTMPGDCEAGIKLNVTAR